jgi:hypothetical protein
VFNINKNSLKYEIALTIDKSLMIGKRIFCMRKTELFEGNASEKQARPIPRGQDSR